MPRRENYKRTGYKFSNTNQMIVFSNKKSKYGLHFDRNTGKVKLLDSNRYKVYSPIFKRR